MTFDFRVREPQRDGRTVRDQTRFQKLTTKYRALVTEHEGLQQKHRETLAKLKAANIEIAQLKFDLARACRQAPTATDPVSRITPEEKPMDDDDQTEYHEGMKAYEEGKSFPDCPYAVGTPECSLWRQGWTSAQRDDR